MSLPQRKPLHSHAVFLVFNIRSTVLFTRHSVEEEDEFAYPSALSAIACLYTPVFTVHCSVDTVYTHSNTRIYPTSRLDPINTLFV